MMITFKDVSKAFSDRRGNAVPVLQSLSFVVPEGKTAVIVGPNGSGKSTILRLIAGLTGPDMGQVLLSVTEKRHPTVGMVFQDYAAALMPWRSCIDNIAFPLEICGCTKSEARNRVAEMAAELKIDFDLTQFPYTLSGGQQQFVAIARALVTCPPVILFDEPFSALDVTNALLVSERLYQYLRRADTTAVMVSHDIDTALYLADEILLLAPKQRYAIEKLEVPPLSRSAEFWNEPHIMHLRAQILRGLK